jgi:hypothetical protein
MPISRFALRCERGLFKLSVAVKERPFRAALPSEQNRGFSPGAHAPNTVATTQNPSRFNDANLEKRTPTPSPFIQLP